MFKTLRSSSWNYDVCHMFLYVYFYFVIEILCFINIQHNHCFGNVLWSHVTLNILYGMFLCMTKICCNNACWVFQGPKQRSYIISKICFRVGVIIYIFKYLLQFWFYLWYIVSKVKYSTFKSFFLEYFNGKINVRNGMSRKYVTITRI